MLLIVTFVHVARGAAGKEISREEGAFSLMPSSTDVAGFLFMASLNMGARSVFVCVVVLARSMVIIITYVSG